MDERLGTIDRNREPARQPLDQEDELVAEDEVEFESTMRAEIRRRVDAARAGNVSAELQEVLDEMDRIRLEPSEDPHEMDEDEDEDMDPAELEAAWAEEISRRVEEIRSGTVKTYAAEDVIAALELRYG